MQHDLRRRELWNVLVPLTLTPGEPLPAAPLVPKSTQHANRRASSGGRKPVARALDAHGTALASVLQIARYAADAQPVAP